MIKSKCAGCPNILKGVSFMHCSRCEDKYHYTCINFSRQDYTALSKELRETWVCPSCKCKEPKSGDNTNTPVRCTGTSTQRQDSGVEHQPQRDAPGFEFENVTLRTRPHSGCTCVSAESIREIIRQELDRKLNSRLDAIQAKLIGFEESLVANHTQNDLLRKENESHRALITVLQKDNEKLRTTSQDLSLRLHVLENLSRSNNLEVQCVPEHKGENLQNTIQQLGKIISCPVTDPDIQYCSRIAKLNNKSPRPRSIIVKFGSRRLRDNFLASVIKYNRNSPKDKLNTSHLGIGGNKKVPIYVTEHLTPETKRLHAAARRVAHQLNYKFVWVRDGKVFLRKSETTGSTIALGIRKVQYAPSKPGPQPCTVVRKDFVLSPGQLELELTLDKQLYMHGETVAVNMSVRNHSNKVVKKIKANVVQSVDVVLFQNGQYRNVVASIETQDGCPLQPGSSLQKVLHLSPTLASNRDKRGVALDGQLKRADTTLASTTLLLEPEQRDAFGIVVSYSVKVKLYLGALSGELVAELPFILMHPKEGRAKVIHADSQADVEMFRQDTVHHQESIEVY